MKNGERERPTENYGKKEQKEWLDNILPDPHPCTAGNKEEEQRKEGSQISKLPGYGNQHANPEAM